MVLVHLQPVVIVIVCHAIATDGGVGGVLDHGLCLAWIHTCFGISTAWLVVWKPLCLDPSDGVFGRFDLAALCGCHTLNVCCCCCSQPTEIRVRGLRFARFGSLTWW